MSGGGQKHQSRIPRKIKVPSFLGANQIDSNCESNQENFFDNMRIYRAIIEYREVTKWVFLDEPRKL